MSGAADDRIRFDEKRVVGLDIGGANLKYADCDGKAFARSFEMWRRCDELADAIAEDMTTQFGDARLFAVTMTGELADCFADRAVGVSHLIDQIESAAERCGVNQIKVYGVDGKFRDTISAKSQVDVVAAANWHALANLVAREIEGHALLVDVGSTTTDLIPIRDGKIATSACTDHDRLIEGSLVYVGCRRSPVCALVNRLTFRGRQANVMNEWFATIDDTRLILGLTAESDSDRQTADGNPRTRAMAANRLARMIGLDRRDVSIEDARELASQIHVAAREQISRSLVKFAEYASCIILSGHGDDLIELPEGAKTLRLAEMIGEDAARCAPSYAVAKLGIETKDQRVGCEG